VCIDAHDQMYLYINLKNETYLFGDLAQIVVLPTTKLNWFVTSMQAEQV